MAYLPDKVPSWLSLAATAAVLAWGAISSYTHNTDNGTHNTEQIKVLSDRVDDLSKNVVVQRDLTYLKERVETTDKKVDRITDILMADQRYHNKGR